MASYELSGQERAVLLDVVVEELGALDSVDRECCRDRVDMLEAFAKKLAAPVAAPERAPVIIITDHGTVEGAHCVEDVRVWFLDRGAHDGRMQDVRSDARAALAVEDLEKGCKAPRVLREYYGLYEDEDEDAV